MVAIGAWTFELVKALCSNLGSLCVVLYEDFSYFSSDIWTYIHAIGNTINNGFKSVIDGIVSGSCNAYESCRKVIMEGGFKMSNFVEAISNLMAFLLMKAREFLILIGNGTWFLVTLIPKLLMSLTIVCWNGCLDLCNHLKKASRITSNRITIATKTAYNYFFDVPLHCALGLFVFYICFRYRYKILRALRIGTQWIYSTIQHYNHEFRMYRIRRQRERQPPQEDLRPQTPPLFTTARNGPSTRKPLRRSPRSPNRKEKSTTSDSSLTCVVCLDRKKTVVVLPCRHLCLCRTCSNLQANFQNTCPLCRNVITQTIDTYM